MKFISPKIHGLIDYISVVFFLTSPAFFGFTGAAAHIAYAVGALNFVLTVFTDFPLGIFRIIPIRIHAALEALVGIALIVLAWTVFKENKLNSALYYDLVGTVILLTWAVTDYKSRYPDSSGALQS